MRPTKYTEELVSKAWEYVNGGYKAHEHAIPSIIGMCRVLNITKTTAYDWASQEEKEFSAILAHCMDAQEFSLVNGGLKNELNSNIVKLALGKHGYFDKQEQTLQGPGGGPIQTDNHWTIEVIEPDGE